MKIRNGFVSNSSSSSFILKLPHYPTSYQDMKKMLLGDEDPMVLTYYDDEAFPTRRIIEIIYNDVIDELGQNRNNSIESISGEEFSISEYSLDEYDSKITSSNKEEYNKLKRRYKMVARDITNAYGEQKNDESSKGLINSLYEEEEEIGNKMGELIIKSIKEQSLNTDIFLTLSYSDNNGSLMSFIEHSDILNPITMSKISHH